LPQNHRRTRPEPRRAALESESEEDVDAYARSPAVLAIASDNPHRPETPALVIHVTHHPNDLNAARLADAVRKACAVPSMKCAVVESSKATTFLHVTVQSVWRRSLDKGEAWSGERPEDPAAQQVFIGFVDIKSRVMIPGSVDGRDQSLERLGAGLLTSVKDRLADRTGVFVIGPAAR
jgi:hypothetical protein